MAPITTKPTPKPTLPSLSATPLLNAPTHDKAMLLDVYALLDTLFTRNRNQHRRSHWWKSLHVFRKQLGLLLWEMGISGAEESGTGGVGIGGVRMRKSERERRVEARLRFWDEKRGGVHVWYCQFSQLVAVGSFAMLGLVLMACVARVCRITGITSAYEEIASKDLRDVLGASDGLALTEEFGGVLEGDEGEGEGWDEGVVIARED